MITRYYKPNDPINKDGIAIDDSWPQDVQQMQRGLAAKNGYLPLVEVGKCETSPFEHSTFDIKKTEDERGNPIYRRTWRTRKIEVHLSMPLMMKYLESMGALEDAMKAIYSDSALSDWWVNKRTFVKGSKEAKYLSRVLNLPEATIEDMALVCREVRK